MSNMNKPQGFSMSDQDMLGDILSTEKMLMEGCNMSITESSCQNMRQVFHNIYQQTALDQYQAFDHMRTRGWYQTKDAPDQEVQQAKQTMQQIKGQL